MCILLVYHVYFTCSLVAQTLTIRHFDFSKYLKYLTSI